MGFFDKVGDFFEDTVDHWDSWLPTAAGALLTAIGLPMIGVPLAGIGSGIANYQKSGNYAQAGLSGIMSGLGSYGAGNMLSGGIQGFKAAGPGFLSKAGGTAQGALFGTTGSGANAQSLLGPGGRSVGLMGKGTLFANPFTGINNLSTGLNAASSLLGGASGYNTGAGNQISIQPYYVPGSTNFNQSGMYNNMGVSSVYGAPGSGTTGVDASPTDLFYQPAKKVPSALTWQYPKIWGRV